MRSRLLIALSAATAIFLAGCHNDNDDPFPLLRIVHAVADAPRVNVYVNGDEILSDVDFRTSSGTLAAPFGPLDIRVEAIVPGGNLDVITVNGLTLASGSHTTIYASGTTANSTIAPLVVEDPTTPVGSGMVRAQVVHASPDAPEVSVFVTAPGAPISSSMPLGSFVFGETLGPVEVPAGDYQIRVAAGNAAGPFDDMDVVFDAGTVSLPAGADLQIAAVTSTVNGTSPITLLVTDDMGSSDLFDLSTGADVRVVHNSPDAPTVDVVVDDNFSAPVVSGISFPEFTPFLDPAVPAGSYNFKVVDSATQLVEAIDFDADLSAGVVYTVFASDFFASINELVLIDDNRRVATEAKLRVVHGSPSAGVVDVYLLAPSALPSDNGVTAAFEDVPFEAETGFFGVVPGTYDVYVTPANDPDTLAISATGITLSASGIYTAVARDAEGGAGGTPLGLILLDDFVTP